MVESKREEIYNLFKTRACTKQDVFQTTTEIFQQFKEVLKEIAEDYTKYVGKLDSRVKVEYSSEGKYQAQIKFGGDLLFFQMHTNVFSFDPDHHIWKTSYVKEDELRAYCGMINVYNFLTDSFRFNRMNDAGYLVSRIFINKDKHYFAEGKKELNYLFKNFVTDAIDKKAIIDLIESSIHYAIRFELQTPPYSHMEAVSVQQIREISNNHYPKTEKRLGFKMMHDKPEQ